MEERLTISELLHTRIYPALYERLDDAFPEFRFRRTARNWMADAGPGLDGTDGKAAGHVNAPNFAIGYLFDYRTGLRRSFWDYLKERDNLSQRETLYKLAELSGETLPAVPEETLEFYARKNREAAVFEAANDFMLTCLHAVGTFDTPEVESVRRYVRERGYVSDDLRALTRTENGRLMADARGDKMELGFLPSIRALREALFSQGFSEEELSVLKFPTVQNKNSASKTRSLSPGETHRLSLPYRNPSGYIKGFTFRSIFPDHNPKYLNTEGLEKGLFMLRGLKGAKEVTLVEGVLDAAVAVARGIANVVALGQTGFSPQRLEELKQYGATSITFCFDNDAAGKAGLDKALTAVLSAETDLRVYVALLPADVKDPDELITRRGADAFSEILGQARLYYKYLADKILGPANLLMEDRDVARLLHQLAETAYRLPETDQAFFIQYCARASFTPGVEVETLTARLRELTAEKESERQRKELGALLLTARAFVEQKNVTRAFDVLEKDLNRIRSISVREAIRPYTSELFEIETRAVTENLRFGMDKLDHRWRLPMGAITVVGARPSHGKTTFMLNLFVNLCHLYPEKRFYFFSYEEERKHIAVKLLNILIDQDLKSLDGNLRYLRGYLRSGKNDDPRVERARVELYQLLDSGRMNLFDTPYPIDELTKVARYVSDTYPTGGFFVDYIQKISNAGRFPTRQAELQNTSDKILQNIAKACGVPVILGAQFNRQALAGAEGIRPQLAHLRESGDIEQDANLVLALYNYAVAGETNNSDGTSVQNSPTFDLEVSVLKNRDGFIGEPVCLFFHKHSLRIW